MNILVINCGSSSLKYQLIDSHSEKVIAKGLCERIGSEGACITHTPAGGEKKTDTVPMPDHNAAIQAVIAKLTDSSVGVITSLSQIGAVGHRIVHGGEKFNKAVLIDDEVISAIEEVSDLAPLHNPANLIGIRACMKLMPGVPMVAVFDTAFHQTMPKEAYLYALPLSYYRDYKIRRYGFHGTSHDYVSRRAAEILGKKREDLRIIVCHLGNGASVTAVDHGRSIDTTMGLTPLEGLIMGTRCGDIDPAIITFLMNKLHCSAEEVLNICNKKSGMLGLSGGISNDFRDLSKAAEQGNEDAETALQAYALRVGKYIGAYAAEMDGADVIVFTAGVGENDASMRMRISNYTKFLGTSIDPEKNKTRAKRSFFPHPETEW
jgi:acetate kinase